MPIAYTLLIYTPVQPGLDDLHASHGCPLPHLPLQLMLFLGWSLQGNEGSFVIDSGWGSFWTKLAASWLCAAMYTWSLVAHRVLSSRQF